MNRRTDVTIIGWDEDLTEEELAARITAIKQQAGLHTPIYDDDDVEQAVEDAADRIASRRAKERPEGSTGA
jgi:hypothetical protein